ncbi:MAG: hypothetical protein AAF710_00475 [Planctomycetota bacterium]
MPNPRNCPRKSEAARPRVALTVRLPAPLYDTARQIAAQRNAPLAAVIAAAAEQTLRPTEEQQADEAAIRDAVQHCLHKLDRLERKVAPGLSSDLHVLKEMVGLAVRTYLNHTAALPETERAAATVSGRARFERFLDVLANSLRDGVSILTPPGSAPGSSNSDFGSDPSGLRHTDESPTEPTNTQENHDE